MIYNINSIVAAARERVGFNQTKDTSTYPALEADLLLSDSGLKVNSLDVNSLATVANFFSSMDLVNGNIDSASLSAELRTLYDAATASVINKTYAKLSKERKSKARLQHSNLFNSVGNLSNTVIPTNSFVGFEVCLQQVENVALILQRIGLQTTEANVGLNIYIYHSSQPDPIHTLSIASDGLSKFSWSDALKTKLMYFNTTHDAGGAFLIGYREDEVQGLAVNRGYDWNSGGCRSCGKKDTYQGISKFVQIRPVSVALSNFSGNTIETGFSSLSTSYSSQTFGLNLQYDVTCDITDYMVNNIDQFDYPIQQEAGYMMLKYIANSVQTSGRNHLAASNIQASMEMIQEQRDSALKAFEFDISGLGGLCMPASRINKAPRYGMV